MSRMQNGKDLMNTDGHEPRFLRKQPRRVRLYFDQHDEMVDEETAHCDENNYYHKYHMVEVDFKQATGGDEDDFEDELMEALVGKKGKENAIFKADKITKETFYGEKPAENAEIFLSTLQKSKVKHLKKVQERELMLAEGIIEDIKASYQSELSNEEGGDSDQSSSKKDSDERN